MAIIALQFSWMAVSAYCGHESGRAARHFGHHQHTGHADELAAMAKEKSPTLAKKLVPHADCSSCTHGTLAPVSLDAVLAHASLNRIVQAVPVSTLSSAYQPPPERPQWTASV